MPPARPGPTGRAPPQQSRDPSEVGAMAKKDKATEGWKSRPARSVADTPGDCTKSPNCNNTGTLRSGHPCTCGNGVRANQK
ncbi:hypothetical protein GCM10027440_38870 [Nocardiopsis coralliicola]